MDFFDRHRWLVVPLLAMSEAVYVVSLPPRTVEPLVADWLRGYAPPAVGLLPEVPVVRAATPEEVRRRLRATLGSGWGIVRTQVASLADPPSGRELVDRMPSQVRNIQTMRRRRTQLGVLHAEATPRASGGGWVPMKWCR